MISTIQIHKDLLEELNKLKKERNAKSYEEVIRMLLRQTRKLGKSHFGTLPKLKQFRREEIDRFD
jgi:predicted CopG family antitoxin